MAGPQRRYLADRIGLATEAGPFLTGRVFTALLMVSGFVAGRGASADEPFRMTPALAAQLSGLECRVVGGRIRLTSRQAGGQMSSSTRGGGRVQERLVLDLSSSFPRLDYQAISPDLRLKIAFSAGEDITIFRGPGDSNAPPTIEFRQQPDGPVTLAWRLGDESGSRREPTFWHLWMAEPALCLEELTPLLQLVRPHWNLEDHGGAIEAALLNAARQSWSDNWPRWTELVAQLADDRFSRRQAADRELRAAGLPVVPFLQGLETARLEPEQRTRIRRILAGLTRFDDEDSPDRVAIWLVGDPRIWLTLLTRDDPAMRRTAATELSELLERPIEFDPDGEPEKRREQLSQLRNELRQERPLPWDDNEQADQNGAR